MTRTAVSTDNATGPWYAEQAGFFGRNFLEEYADWMRPAETAAQVEFVVAHASKAGRRVLDVGCGNGRHLERLAQRGFSPVGLDLNRGMLERGRVVLADMRRIPFASAFDTAVNLFSSFGYFSDEENGIVLREIARCLAPGGRFILDVLNADFVRSQPGERTETVRFADGSQRRHDRLFDPFRSRLYHRRSYEGVDGDLRCWFSDVRIYSPGELVNVTRDAGFRNVALSGGFRGQEVGAAHPRLVYVGELPA
jgi:SAM-dependent methyltransferase